MDMSNQRTQGDVHLTPTLAAICALYDLGHWKQDDKVGRWQPFQATVLIVTHHVCIMPFLATLQGKPNVNIIKKMVNMYSTLKHVTCSRGLRSWTGNLDGMLVGGGC